VNRIALIALALLLPGCSLFLPAGAGCSRRDVPIFSSCPPAVTGATRRTATLDDTHWKLVQLGDTAVRDGLMLREPHLMLDANRRHLSGSGGCNLLTGRYTQDGTDGIRFEDLISTKMACQGMGIEQGLLKSLEQARHWRIAADRLQLMDAGGAVLAAFLSTQAP
jgi:heat shock protein HslJ